MWTFLSSLIFHDIGNYSSGKRCIYVGSHLLLLHKKEFSGRQCSEVIMEQKNGNDSSKKYINHICNELKLNRAAVLIGAGFSRNSDRRSTFAKEYPLWDGLGKFFAQKMSLDDIDCDKLESSSPIELADQLEIEFGRSELERTILKAIPDEQYLPSPLHTKLLQMPWVDVFTTNYDTLLERASQEISYKRFNIVTCKEDLVGSAGLPRIVKLHGSFPSNRPFIITSKDYQDYPQNFAPFINTVQQAMLENTFCMIGFSGNDPNFKTWIKWIKENLKENAPRMYLITHKTLPDSEINDLRKENIIYVNISMFGNKENPRSQYETFFDYILENVSQNIPDEKVIWPNYHHYKSIVNYDSDNNIEDTLKILKQSHMEYPGWLITPKKSREMLKSIKIWIERHLYSLRLQQNEYELEFLFEYDWIREKCLLSLTPDEISTYNAIINRTIANHLKNEQKSMITQTLISLMKKCRECGNFEKWKEYYEKVEGFSNSLEHDLKQRLAFESCLYLLFTYKYQESKDEIHRWTVLPEEHLWSLYKGGLLCELNDFEEAYQILSTSLDSLQKQLQYEEGDIYQLSIESTMMSLLQHLPSELTKPFDSAKSGEKCISTNKGNSKEHNKKRRQIHRDLNVDWFEENNELVNQLNVTHIPYKQKSTKRIFDFGRVTITTNIGIGGIRENKELTDAIAFLRFREETAHPLIIQNITNGTNAVVKAAERISKASISWSIITLVRVGDVKSLDSVITRQLLSSISHEEINSWTKFYSDALLRLNEQLDNNNLLGKGFAGCCLNVLPALLSRFCCKCSIEMLDEIQSLTLQIYNSNNKWAYKEVQQLINRLMDSFSSEEKLIRLPTLLQYPLNSEKNLLHGFIDPVLLIPVLTCSEKEIVFSDNEILEINELLIKSKITKDEYALTRLLILTNHDMLTKKQHTDLVNVIEKAKNELSTNFLLNALLYINLPDKLVTNIKLLLKNRIKKSLEYHISAQSFGYGSDPVKDFLNLAKYDGYIDEDVNELISTCKLLIDKLVSRSQNENWLRNSTDRICDICYALSHISTKNPDWIPNDETINLMKGILDSLDENRIYCQILEIMWANKINFNFDDLSLIHDLLTNDEHRCRGVLGTIDFSIYYGDNITLNSDVQKECLEILCQQIMWRHQESLESVINIVNSALIKKVLLLSDGMERNLRYGLENLYIESQITDKDSTDIASTKGSIRIAAFRLASTLQNYYYEQSLEIPKQISDWNSLSTNMDEFAEIRNAVKM